jgi:thioredoxin-like negative regulator of GroEL
MKRLPHFTLPLLITTAALALVGLVAVLAAPAIGSHLNTQADRLVHEAMAAEGGNPQAAAIRYEMAAFVRPGDHTILNRLADMYIRLDQPDTAIAVLRRLPKMEAGDRIADLQLRSGQYQKALDTLTDLLSTQASSNRLVAKSHALLELDRGAEALQAAKDATAYALSDSAAKRNLVLCQLVAGDEAGYQAAVASLGAAEPAGAIQSAHASQIALGRELYALGLLRTSERVLNSTDSTATERYVLVAKIKLVLNNLPEAKDQLVRATKLDPANIDAHKLLEEVLLKQNDEAGANEQAKLVKSLQTGQL